MSLITYPLNNIDYTAEDAELFHCTRASGVWAENSFGISVTGTDNNVTIGTGIAWINNGEFSGKVAALKTAETHDIGIADGAYPRIDVIALQFNVNNNATEVVVKKGTPATNPIRPGIVRTESVYELYLASIYRPAGATVITSGNITDLRMDKTVCGLMADSVTKIDLNAIHAQFMGLVKELETAIQNIEVGEIVPVEKGGTGKSTIPEARQTLNFIGNNPISGPQEDTPAKWNELGTGVAFISPGTLDNQPSGVGFLVNNVHYGNVSQVFIAMDTLSTTYIRTGKSSGWYTTGWVKALNENNGIQKVKLWTNASPTSEFVAQKIELPLSEYDYYEILARYSAEITNRVSARGRTGQGVRLQSVGASGGNVVACVRNCDYSATYLRFYDGARNGATDNSVLVPMEIYGIKGVQ